MKQREGRREGNTYEGMKRTHNLQRVKSNIPCNKLFPFFPFFFFFSFHNGIKESTPPKTISFSLPPFFLGLYHSLSLQYPCIIREHLRLIQRIPFLKEDFTLPSTAYNLYLATLCLRFTSGSSSHALDDVVFFTLTSRYRSSSCCG